MATFTALCIDDSVNSCDCCGRTDLKATVLMESDLGELVNFGRVCAARNSGKEPRDLKREMSAARRDAMGRVGNRLLDLRRAGTRTDRAVVLATCDELNVRSADDRAVMVRIWVR